MHPQRLRRRSIFFSPNPPIFDKLEDIIGRAIPALCVLWSLMISQCTKGRIGSALQHFCYHRVFSATQDDPYTSYQTMKSATLVLHFAYRESNVSSGNRRQTIKVAARLMMHLGLHQNKAMPEPDRSCSLLRPYEHFGRL